MSDVKRKNKALSKKNSKQKKESNPKKQKTEKTYEQRQQKQRDAVQRIREMAPSDKLEEIASLCQALTTNPEENVSKLGLLHKHLTEAQTPKMICLALLSELSVLNDILPGYRIRLPTEAEKQQKTTKDVRKQRMYEAALLHAYEVFLGYLRDAVNGKSTAPSVKNAAVRAACTLLNSHNDFNYLKTLYDLIVPNVIARDEQVAEMCCSTIDTLIQRDHSGRTTRDIVKAISDLVRARNFNVKPSLLNVFLSVKIHSGIASGSVGLDKQKKKKKRKTKRTQLEKELDRDMEEAEARVDPERLRELQSDTIRFMFLCFCRVIRAPSAVHLLPPVLAGLSRFAQFIDINLLLDLFQELKAIIVRADIPFESVLHCIVTAFRTTRGDGAMLNVDLHDYFTALYARLPDMIKCDTDSHFSTALQCVLDVLRDRRHTSVERVAAFIKRLAAISLNLLPHRAAAVLLTIETLMHRYPRTNRLLDSDQASGRYLCDLNDPDCCNSLSASLWELSLLKFHFHPRISAAAVSLGKLAYETKEPSTADPLAVFAELQPHDALDSTLHIATRQHPLSKLPANEAFLPAPPVSRIPSALSSPATRMPRSVFTELLQYQTQCGDAV